MRTIQLAVLFAMLSAAPGWASIVLHLTASTQDAQPGDTIVFGGYIENNFPQVVDLNGLSISLSGLFTIDTSPFFDLSAPFTVDAGPSTTVVYNWFTVTVADPYTDPLGLVSGTVSLLGGLEGPFGYDPGVQDLLASASFSVNVIEPGTGTPGIPEPSTCLMLVSGAALLYARRRTQNAPGGRDTGTAS
ncbi:MAG: PEP-CTERM sorting domain-containing protein [Bryobacterales bacterium]|nr:PEP-CTERM sorting domain-containing protein [Bryobacterales bacterium]